MIPFRAERVGAFNFVLFDDGVVADVVLTQTKGHHGGWIVMATG